MNKNFNLKQIGMGGRDFIDERKNPVTHDFLKHSSKLFFFSCTLYSTVNADPAFNPEELFFVKTLPLIQRFMTVRVII